MTTQFRGTFIFKIDPQITLLICPILLDPFSGAKVNNLEPHHLIRRSHFAMRHRVECGLCLCQNHHRFDSEISPHLAPKAFEAWLQTVYPEQYQWAQEHKCRQITEKVDYQKAYEALRETVAMNL